MSDQNRSPIDRSDPTAAAASCTADLSTRPVVSFSRLPSDVLSLQILRPYFGFQEAMDLRQVERSLKQPAEKCAVQWLGRRFPCGRATLAQQQPDSRPVYSLTTAVFVQLKLDRPRPSRTDFLSRNQLLLRYGADCDCDDRQHCDCNGAGSWRAYADASAVHALSAGGCLVSSPICSSHTATFQ